ncbi:DUF3857 domain-containing protein [Aequorivita marisscotiae]|uniref:DUF3857 domain-containing protein n=1 Tax=Aequorivita marisscotiae TaxID=3040348 RepID=A0ABY8KRC6_9FLAO|nr:DUF3857 domain-containing protein [Aequorivita sp. Ant34-E75]WGF92013.1 DUF3857 domain-containing protein [Aequorivita sp. Ant34-E75]
MHPLFSKPKRASFAICILAGLFYSFNATVTNTTVDPFLTICKNSDAYFTHSYKDVTYEKFWSSYKKHISIDNKLVVNTPLGVEKYAFLTLNEFESNNIESIKIRTLKANGTIVELDSSLVFRKNSPREKFGAIHYPIPAVEPGDTIETHYVYSERIETANMKSYINLYANLPSVNSQYTIKTGPQLTVRYKTYNDFPSPAVIANDTIVYLQFSMNNVIALEENEHSCLPCEKPYLYYSLEKKDSELRSWRDVYNEEFNFLTQPMALDKENSSYYNRWMRRVIGSAKDSSKYYQFQLLYNEILANFKMLPIDESEFIKSTGYFLKEERFDPISIRRFYRQLLEDLEIDYWAVFGRSKRLGSIDTDYIRKGEFDHIFFAFKNAEGDMQLLYPHNELYMYLIDEIPTSLYSTKAVLVKPNAADNKKKKAVFIDRDLQLARVDSVSVATINLPGMDSNYNYINQSFSGNVDIEKKKTTFRYRLEISGGMSTEMRSFYSMLSMDEEVSNFYSTLSEFEGENNTIQIDTVTNRLQKGYKPFVNIMSGEGTLNNAITFVNDSLVSVSIDKLIQHFQLEKTVGTSELNYYLDYNYSDYFTFYLNFPCKIEVLGLENGKIDFKNDLGEYFFELVQSKDNQLKIQSNYTILKNLILKEKLTELNHLNENVTNAKSKRLIIKLNGTH